MATIPSPTPTHFSILKCSEIAAIGNDSFKQSIEGVSVRSNSNELEIGSF